MINPKAIAAAFNNSSWCNSVCLAHGCPCEFIAGAWFNRGTPPPYYPHLVTFEAGSRTGAQEQLIHEHTQAHPTRGFGFKDSFSCIDPSAAGQTGRTFRLLFEASWLWLDASRFMPRGQSLRWSRAQTTTELMEFERGWRGDHDKTAANDHPRQFPDSLLMERDVAFLMGRSSAGRVMGVAVANRTTSDLGDVVGLSNVSGKEVAADDLWTGATAAAIEAFPSGLPLVGYERDDDLEQAIGIGFEPTQKLRVFLSDALK